MKDCDCELCRDAREWEEYGERVGNRAQLDAVIGVLAIVALAVLMLAVWPVL